MTVSYNDSDIETAEGLEHPRMHPGLYGFDVHSQQGQFQLMKEALDNAVDEATVAPHRTHHIDITYNRRGKKYQAVVTDQGRGAPLGKIVPLFTVIGTSGKWGNSYSASIGTYGVGIKATAALSRRFCAASCRQDGSAVVTTNKGVVVHTKVSRRKVKDSSVYGTAVLYEPDPSILTASDLFFEEGNGYMAVMDLVGFLSAFIPNAVFSIYEGKQWIDDKILTGEPRAVYDALNGNKGRRLFQSIQGISPTKYMTNYFGIDSPIIWESGVIRKELSASDPNDRMGYHIEFFMSKDFAKRGANIMSAVNMTKIIDKTSVQNYGLWDTIKRFLLPFITDTDVGNYFETVYRLPMNMVIMAKWQGATFIGQDKNRFTDKDFLNAYVADLSLRFSELGESYWEDLYEQLSEDIEDKYHKYNNRDMKIGIGLKNMADMLNNPNAYVGCRSKDNTITELFLTEGTSAGDFVKQVCNKNFQAVFKLRGKPINPFKCDKKRLTSNDIYQDLVRVIGVGPSDKDMSSCNFNRIGLLTDADADGYHIASLLVGILYKINPLILSTGKVFLANPPLYVLQLKNKTLFARDKRAYNDAKIAMYEEGIRLTVQTDNGESYLTKGPVFRDMAYMILHVGRKFANVANKLILDPMHLEMIRKSK